MKTAAIAVSSALLIATSAFGQVLYKLIDKNGKVTYSEKAPEKYDGQVIRLEINPNANTATLPKLQAAPAAEAPAAPAPEGGAAKKSDAASAKERLEGARRALDAARESTREEDFRFIPNAGGGMRRVPTDEHAARLEALEQAVKKAEAEAGKSEGGR